MTAGFFCRSDPAALLRGLANGALPSSTGNITDGAGIEGDVLADSAVTTGRGPLKAAIAIDERDRHPVDFELAEIVRIGAKLGLHPHRPRREFVGVEDIVEAEHALEMLGRGELGGEAGPTHELRGRVRHPQFRKTFLECDKLVEQRVELGVGDDRCVFDVIPELVLTHLIRQFLPTTADIGIDRISFRIVGSHPGRLPRRPRGCLHLRSGAVGWRALGSLPARGQTDGKRSP